MITVEAKKFKSAVTLVSKAIERRNTLPILGSIMFEVTPGNLRMVATNLEQGLIVDSDATGDETWSVCVPAKALKNALKSITAKSAPVTLASDGKSLTINGITLVGDKPSEFPVVPMPDPSLPTLITSDLAPAVTMGLPAVTTDETRFAVSGMLWSNGAIVATDGHRLVRAQAPDYVPTRQVLVPRAACAILGALQGPITVAMDEKHVWARAGSITLITRTLDGVFPQYEKVIPLGSAHDRYVLDLTEALRDSLINAMAPLPANDRTHAIRLTLNGAVTLRAESPDVGEGTATVNAALRLRPNGADPGEVTLSLRREYLADALRLPVERLRIKDAETQIHLQGAGIDVVIMPMRA